MPRYPSDTSGANALRGTPHSRISVGMTMPSNWLSMPSKTMVRAVRKNDPALVGAQRGIVQQPADVDRFRIAECWMLSAE